jgi:hypothetical protein
MFTQHIDMRITLARSHKTCTNIEPKAELGVCMGYDLTTGRTLFLLANGSIVPRPPTSQFPYTFVRFDWTPKQVDISNLEAVKAIAEGGVGEVGMEDDCSVGGVRCPDVGFVVRFSGLLTAVDGQPGGLR